MQERCHSPNDRHVASDSCQKTRWPALLGASEPWVCAPSSLDRLGQPVPELTRRKIAAYVVRTEAMV